MEFNQEALEAAIYYTNERESIRQKKEAGLPKPWTDDPVLQQYSFTNILRRHDKTSRFLIDNYYSRKEDCPFEEALFNAMVFRYFGSIAYAKEVGWTSLDELKDPFRLEYKLLDAVSAVRKRGEKPFTAAYVVTNAGLSLPKEQVVINHFLMPFLRHFPTLKKIWEEDSKPARWRPLAEYMVQNVNGCGAFMAKEILQDVTYTHVLHGYRDRDEWTPMGPGAIRGMNRILGEPLTSSKGKDLNAVRKLREILMENFKPHMLVVSSEFDLHSVQFALCEIDKMLRTRNKEGRPKRKYSGRK